MNYIVSGYMRCGTSMMMQAIDAGGIRAVYNSAENMSTTERCGDEFYDPTPGGPFEFKRSDIRRSVDFPCEHDGCVVKIFQSWLPNLPKGKTQYKIAYMMRPTEEMAESMRAFFGEGMVGWLMQGYYPDALNAMLVMSKRDDIQFEVVSFPDVISDPIGAFGRLHDAGWPIDVEAAAEVIDPQLYRHRLAEIDAARARAGEFYVRV